MAISNFSERESAAIQSALSYWVERWNWESPILFGLDLSEMKAMASNWERALESNQEGARIAIVGAFRELLYGAGAIPKTSVGCVIGISYDEAAEVMERFGPHDI